MKKYLIILTNILIIAYSICTFAQEIQSGEKSQPSNLTAYKDKSEQGGEIDIPVIKMITPGIFEIGGIYLDKKEGTVEFDSVLNMDKGLLEYLIVGNSGKVHESLLKTEIEPYNLQIALLLIGLEGSMNPLSEQGDPRRPDGDSVRIRVKWENKGKIYERPIEEWVFRKDSNSVLGPTDWVFTGSVISNGVFMAQVEKSIVAVYHDPTAMIDNPMPEGASDEIWFVNEHAVPPIGTKVTVSIKIGDNKGRGK